MAECRDAAASSEEGQPLERALRATIADVPGAQAYRAFISHAAECADCRTEGVDCAAARSLRQAWRDARRAATR